ncbi:hypothetical protein SS50377_20447 [Spironucleus salmonicida]|uniref:Uncharacterized protein n=1 Tax=Spironucleus salmonicida TaxID=348837 RepID=V6LMZ5_9EUKA|nr:hypothetical protein SS50377_20435 [Spironucleus salmonicida]KAH0577097.1 hypothetical protein SS50377_20447 [Spironucleus salmonicida]|eukprot:EST45593.1 Hypothetical protein SS50377_14440 [Spironucleus salmonicida]
MPPRYTVQHQLLHVHSDSEDDRDRKKCVQIARAIKLKNNEVKNLIIIARDMEERARDQLDLILTRANRYIWLLEQLVAKM